jgi:hypothetical protein
MSASGSEAAPASPDFLEGFISEEDYAARRGVSRRTCQRDRQLRQSPPYVVIGRRVFLPRRSGPRLAHCPRA